MAATQPKGKKGFNFTKKNKVSIWVSQHPYQDIPDDYFDETFSHEKTRATNTWSNNFRLQYFEPDFMDSNGAQTGTVDIKKAAGECSFSTSYIEALLNKAKKKNLTSITWIVLLYEHEYSVKQSGIGKDTYMTFVGAFDYDESAESLFE